MSLQHKVVSQVLALAVMLGMSVCQATPKVAGKEVAETQFQEQARELQNRFRIDHLVERVTLVIQREYGSGPVVVVQPDGSKWYANRHPANVTWNDGLTGDIISINQPQPGPWQVLGNVVKGSQIRLFSQLAVDMDPIPQPLFQGERLRLTARLMGDKERLRLPGLDYLVEWTARMVSHSLPDEDNIASGTLTVGSYKDDGELLDERPDDGIFTSDLNLNHPQGQYDFVLQARNNVFDRELKSAITLSARPVEVKLITPTAADENYQLEIYLNSTQLKPESIQLALALKGPYGYEFLLNLNGEALLAQAQAQQNPVQYPDQHKLGVAVIKYPLPQLEASGSYRIKTEAFATTSSDREIVLTLPELLFNHLLPASSHKTASQAATTLVEADDALKENQAKRDVITLLLSANLMLLCIGLVGIIFWHKRLVVKQTLITALKPTKNASSELHEPPPKRLRETLDTIELTMPRD